MHRILFLFLGLMPLFAGAQTYGLFPEIPGEESTFSRFRQKSLKMYEKVPKLQPLQSEFTIAILRLERFKRQLTVLAQTSKWGRAM